tara:strand:- start:1608 stop:2768 length:1161 start_codon:yes stop_codon:yes gene_type:complete
MKILFLSFYFKPDLCAGSFRNTALVNSLKKRKEVKHIDVITTMPNRYKSYVQNPPKIEITRKVTINRYEIGSHNSGMFDQSKSFFNFAYHTFQHIDDKKYDLIYASSSRLMTGFLGALISKKLKTPIYLDIRDIFTEILLELLPKPISFLLHFPLKIIEKFTINQAKKVNIVSGGFKNYFDKNFNKTKISNFPNGIDNEFIKELKQKKIYSSNRIILYAGNIGEGQGLEKILPEFAIKLKDWNFRVIGDGGTLHKLQKEVNKIGMKNIKILPPISRKKLIEEYLRSDILFLHLNHYKSFEKVLPSKIFEYAATGKPILAGVRGFPNYFIKKNIENASCFEPCNLKEAIRCFAKLKLKTVRRDKFIKKYSRKNQMELLAHDVISSIK